MSGNLKLLRGSLTQVSGCINDHDPICHCRPVDVRLALDEIERLRAERDRLREGFKLAVALARGIQELEAAERGER